ncbi:PadR family transcriptional regulator [Sphingomonas sp.]|uniref:PadR family transcriptional regulator n=1 Tax=Sphingomonas sp. TaxID=28214 RepID=UPI0025D78856|nr:PadR family transcriptional regulator [Sphingomonas sp.]
MHFHYECDDHDNHRRHAGGRGRSFRFGPFDFDFDFDGAPGRAGWGGGRRGRTSKRMFSGGELRLVLLKLIADQPRHGYELIKAIEDMTGGEYAPSPGVVYPTLTMLEDMGHIAEKKSKDSKKVFEATADGRTHLDENSDEVDELIERLEGHGHSRRRGQRPEIGRAIGNLMTALRNRIAHEGWNEQLLNEVVDILDEAAQRIERVKDAKPEDPGDD